MHAIEILLLLILLIIIIIEIEIVRENKAPPLLITPETASPNPHGITDGNCMKFMSLPRQWAGKGG